MLPSTIFCVDSNFAICLFIQHFQIWLLTVVLDGSNSYHSWSQNMIVFFKGRKFWRYVTKAIPKPVPKPPAKAIASNATPPVDVDFEIRLEEWKSIQCKILSWFINTFVPTINRLLPRLETTQAAWSFLATRYNCTHDSYLEFHLEFKFY